MIRDEREVKRRERETRPRKGTRRNSSTIDDRGKLSRVGFKGGRGEKYPRTVSRLFVEGPCCDSFGQGRALYAGTAGNWPWNIYEAVSPPPGGRARTSPPIPMHPGLSTGLRQQLL